MGFDMFKKITNLYKKFKGASRKKKIVVVGIVLAVGIFGIIQYRNATKPPDYFIEAAKIDSLVELVSETGNVTTAGVTPVYSTTTGVVDEVLVENGDVITEDQELFSVKSTATKQEQDAALATYMTTKSALETAKATQLSAQATLFGKWDTFKELAEGDEYEEEDGTPKYVERGVAEFHVPEKEWLAAESAYKNQQQIVSEKSVAASAAWQAYQATQDGKLTALLGGVVRNLGVAKGDLVTVPTPILSVTPALILEDESVEAIIMVAVNETDAIKVKEGQKAELEFDAISSKTFIASVDRVDTIASPEMGVIKYNVYLLLEEDVAQLQRGMTVDVDITVASLDNILTVPSSSVKPYQGGKAVRVVDKDGEIEFVPVVAGSKGDGKTEILSGIEEGREVIVTLTNEQNERSGGFF